MYHIKQDKRSQHSSAQIYQALRALMKEKNFDSITVTEVVARAGVGRATFYRNFDAMKDVLYLECDRRFGELTELLRDLHSTAAAKNRIPLEASRVFLEFWYEDSEIIELLVQARCFGALMRALEEMFIDLSQPYIRRYSVPEKFLEYIMAMQCGTSAGMLLRWIDNGKDIPPHEMAKLMEQTARGLDSICIGDSIKITKQLDAGA